ncbi:FkbM family methyltransferase [Jannaschia ovalis]|uniref:FkbM family methyltransferase n=1 Tax=Jannaschia ovalis TaxID=3038773 RepID=A0ABY8LFG2_9RHOB|nr:FkbM family methyltransferase [Jannaschia sp. GRR-S6-38]WGH79080.1 FkbM family methyltransferase [Jannaschia sp. GRR-S6-38]
MSEELAALLARKDARIQRLQKRMTRMSRIERAQGFLDGIIATLRPGMLAVDCGANVGDVTRRIAASGADVVAFEPDPWTFAELQRRTADLDNVTCINAAVGDSDDEVTIFRTADFDGDPEKNSLSSTVTPGKKYVSEAVADTRVRQIDLAEWIEARGGVAFVKMDIEGGEVAVLERLFARGTIDKIGAMVVETHPQRFPAMKDRYAALDEKCAAIPARRINLDWV